MATHMTRCGFCRCLTYAETGVGPASRRQETAPLRNGSLLPDDALFGETYCRECDRFYQQLITFGRGDGWAIDWGRPELAAQALTQPEITTRAAGLERSGL